MRPSRPRQAGFTLIEVLVAMVITAILASIAWPSYQNQIYRSRRSDAAAALSVISQAQERWRANNPAYQETLASLPGGMSTSPGGHYDLTMVAVTASTTTSNANTYIARATAKSTSPQYNDTNCRAMQVSMSNGRLSYTSSNSDAANTDPDPCWAK